jgi:hypothetical protein
MKSTIPKPTNKNATIENNAIALYVLLSPFIKREIINDTVKPDKL